MRPIDADALIDEARKDGAYGYVDIYQIIDAPTLDVAPVVHGEWIQHGNVDEGFQFFLCSNCNAVGHPIFHHCPNCGAKMRGEHDV